MNNLILVNVWRFVVLVILQGLIFQNVGSGSEDFKYLDIIVYPIFIMLLPLRTPRVLVMGLGFVLGLTVDAFYSTPGVHASAAVFTAFARPLILKILEPRAGYNVNYSPTAARMGQNWFYRYTAIFMLLHLFFYFSVEAFTFVFIFNILLKTLVSFIVSMIFVVIFQVVFNPVD